MASSVIVATQALYASLNPANFPSGTLPPLYFDKPPEVISGNQVIPPYVVQTDGGTMPDFDFGLTPVETTSTTLDVFAPTLGAVDQIVEAIKYNGQAIDAGAGFDFGSLPGLNDNYRNLVIKRVRETRYLAGQGTGGQRIHGCKLEYRIQLERQS